MMADQNNKSRRKRKRNNANAIVQLEKNSQNSNLNLPSTSTSNTLKLSRNKINKSSQNEITKKSNEKIEKISDSLCKINQKNKSKTSKNNASSTKVCQNNAVEKYLNTKESNPQSKGNLNVHQIAVLNKILQKRNSQEKNCTQKNGKSKTTQEKRVKINTENNESDRLNIVNYGASTSQQRNDPSISKTHLRKNYKKSLRKTKLSIINSAEKRLSNLRKRLSDSEIQQNEEIVSSSYKGRTQRKPRTVFQDDKSACEPSASKKNTLVKKNENSVLDIIISSNMIKNLPKIPKIVGNSNKNDIHTKRKIDECASLDHKRKIDECASSDSKRKKINPQTQLQDLDKSFDSKVNRTLLENKYENSKSMDLQTSNIFGNANTLSTPDTQSTNIFGKFNSSPTPNVQNTNNLGKFDSLLSPNIPTCNIFGKSNSLSTSDASAKNILDHSNLSSTSDVQGRNIFGNINSFLTTDVQTPSIFGNSNLSRNIPDGISIQNNNLLNSAEELCDNNYERFDSYQNIEMANDFGSRNNSSNVNTVNNFEHMGKLINIDPGKNLENIKSQPFEEEMDWESVVEEIIQVREDLQYQKCTAFLNILDQKNIEYENNEKSDVTFVVIDTNIFISHLNTIEDLINVDTKDLRNVIVMVPWVVVRELDKLKLPLQKSFSNTNMMARKAMKFLHENLPTNSKLKGQSLKVANDHIFPCIQADDEILNCCLQIANNDEDVVLLTNDINLCIKANVNNVKVFTHKQFVSDFLENITLQSTKDKKQTHNEDLPSSRINNKEIYFSINAENKTITNDIKFKQIEILLKDFLSLALENEMKQTFNELWIKIILVEPPWTLCDIIKCLIKHWIAVFKEILPKDALNVLKDLQGLFPHTRKSQNNNYTDQDINVFVSSSVKLIEYFGKDPQYSKQALKCLSEILCISKDTDKPNVQKRVSNEIVLKSCEMDNYCDNVNVPENKQCRSSNDYNTTDCNSSSHIINILKIIFDSLGIFCCTLADKLDVSNNLNITHDSNASLKQLVPQASAVGNQLELIINCISRVLFCYTIDNLPPETKQAEVNLAIETLYNILLDTMSGLGQKIILNKEELLLFSAVHRNILEEANNKFLELKNLIIECSQKFISMQLDYREF